MISNMPVPVIFLKLPAGVLIWNPQPEIRDPEVKLQKHLPDLADPALLKRNMEPGRCYSQA